MKQKDCGGKYPSDLDHNASPVLENRLSQGLGTENDVPILKKGLLQGLGVGNDVPVLEKRPKQGLKQGK